MVQLAVDILQDAKHARNNCCTFADFHIK